MEKRMDMPVEEIPVYRQSADYARKHGPRQSKQPFSGTIRRIRCIPAAQSR